MPQVSSSDLSDNILSDLIPKNVKRKNEKFTLPRPLFFPLFLCSKIFPIVCATLQKVKVVETIYPCVFKQIPQNKSSKISCCSSQENPAIFPSMFILARTPKCPQHNVHTESDNCIHSQIAWYRDVASRESLAIPDLKILPLHNPPPP